MVPPTMIYICDRLSSDEHFTPGDELLPGFSGSRIEVILRQGMRPRLPGYRETPGFADGCEEGECMLGWNVWILKQLQI